MSDEQPKTDSGGASGSVTSHKRIAANTIALYIRGLLSVCIGLYTSRVVIETLGVDDYGVYGIAGGFVAMLAFINSAMSGATSRFITYEMGLGDRERTRQTFANALMVHIWIAALILVVCEAVGVWFINTQLNIPPDRMYAANVVFQLSILTAAITITQVPYTALIISHERMKIYAYMEIINVSLKLAIVYFLVVLPGDKLIVYAILTAVVALGVAMGYRIYCLRHFTEARTGPKVNNKIIKPLLSFSTLDLFGNMCVTVRNQGNTFLLNIFFGVAINGAASIAAMLNGTLAGFSNNIVTAVRPQIIKNYARQSWREFQHLIEFGSQVSTLLLAMMAIPLVFETHYIYTLWLGQVPAYVVVFTRITILTAIVSQMLAVINIGIHSTGRIKSISFISGSICLVGVAVIYVFLRMGFPPPAAFVILLGEVCVITIVNIVILKHQVTRFRVGRYIRKILVLPLMCVPAVVACAAIHWAMPTSFVRFAGVGACSVALVGIVAFLFVLTTEQRRNVIASLKRKLHLSK